MRSGADPLAVDQAGNSALHKAARENAAAALDSLLGFFSGGVAEHVGSADADGADATANASGEGVGMVHAMLVLRNEAGQTAAELALALRGVEGECLSRYALSSPKP